MYISALSYHDVKILVPAIKYPFAWIRFDVGLPYNVENSNMKMLLTLYADDIEFVYSGKKQLAAYQPFTKQQAIKVVKFYRKIKARNIDTIVVSCMAGQSRSAAVAAALTEMGGESSQSFWRTKFPNRMIFGMIYDAAQNRGMIK
jgi:predicted protein tyrosine phosphatase